MSNFPETLFDKRLRHKLVIDRPFDLEISADIEVGTGDDMQLDFIGAPNPDWVGENPGPPPDDEIPF